MPRLIESRESPAGSPMPPFVAITRLSRFPRAAIPRPMMRSGGPPPPAPPPREPGGLPHAHLRGDHEALAVPARGHPASDDALGGPRAAGAAAPVQIGRASCRERV